MRNGESIFSVEGETGFPRCCGGQLTNLDRTSPENSSGAEVRCFESDGGRRGRASQANAVKAAFMRAGRGPRNGPASNRLVVCHHENRPGRQTMSGV